MCHVSSILIDQVEDGSNGHYVCVNEVLRIMQHIGNQRAC